MGTGGLKPYPGVYPVAKDDPEYPIHKRQWAAAGIDIEKNSECEHNWRFLRQRIEPLPESVLYDPDRPTTDIFYCTKCLAKREVPA